MSGSAGAADCSSGGAHPYGRDGCRPLPALHRDALGRTGRGQASCGRSGLGKERGSGLQASLGDPLLAPDTFHPPTSLQLLARLSLPSIQLKIGFTWLRIASQAPSYLPGLTDKRIDAYNG